MIESSPAAPSLSAELAHKIEGFELALDVNPPADLAAFLPRVAHPLYLDLATLVELVRVDWDRAWATGERAGH
ncbi:MAG: hypothetical protein FJ304_18550 [Planctomycetes bacterium]|nr:hypothetical protein [Planctomycetota bacterium]